MTVGGDSTQFSMGLMAYLTDSLAAGRLPFWNDLWGFGFPGFSESQMGVLAPAHWLAYGLFSVESATTGLMLVHAVWGGVGVGWLAGRMGVSRWGAVVSALAWSMCGFFVIHLPHQWAFSSGCWMPWAVGLVWNLIQASDARSRSKSSWWLAAVLALQILPGHFQLAFETEVTVAVLMLWAMIERPLGGRAAVRSLGGLVIAGSTAVILTLGQLAPTFELARLSSDRRDFEYLSGFASPPLHLVNLVSPELFHRDPLWRPLLWDPFHTSPEEHLPYIGLAPLALAILAVVRGSRGNPAVRALAVLAAAALILSMGPYVPGFAWWCELPGFNLFRAPARWGLVLSLALAVLAGIGWDGLTRLARPRRSLVLLSIVLAGWLGLVVAVVELGWNRQGVASDMVADEVYNSFWRLNPWNEPTTRAMMVIKGREPLDDLRTQVGLARLGHWNPATPRSELIFTGVRSRIYEEECLPALVKLAVLCELALLVRPLGALRAGLILFTLADLLWLGWSSRNVDTGPLGSLVKQSPVLSWLKKEVPGERVIGSMGNLPMVAGVGPVRAYRTLDVPIQGPLVELAHAPLGNEQFDAQIRAAMRAVGSRTRILDPLERDLLKQRAPNWAGWRECQELDDPSLASWLYGADWVRAWGEKRRWTFAIWRRSDPAALALAWSIASPKATDPAATSSSRFPMLDDLEHARPIMGSITGDRPEHLNIPKPFGAGGLVASVLSVPGWIARDGDGRPISISNEFDTRLNGWLRLMADDAVSPIRLTYQMPGSWGLAVMAAGWCLWITVGVWGTVIRVNARVTTGERAVTEPSA